jgi:hypothetical protein
MGCSPLSVKGNMAASFCANGSSEQTLVLSPISVIASVGRVLSDTSVWARQQVANRHSPAVSAIENESIARLHFIMHCVAAK